MNRTTRSSGRATDCAAQPETKRSTEGSSAMNVNDLSDDTLCLIFSKISDTRNLCYAMEVCRRWRTVCLSNPGLWEDLVLPPPKGPYSVYERKPRVTKRRRLSPAFTSLSSSPSDPGMKTAIEFMTSRSKKLRRLDLRHVRRGEKPARLDDLTKIQNRSTASLETLVLNGCQFGVSPDDLKDSLSTFSNLRVLHATSFRSMRMKTLAFIAKRCTHLEEIDISNSVQVRGGGLAAALHPVRKTMRRIVVSGTWISNLPLMELGKYFPLLDEIRADNCQHMCKIPLPIHFDWATADALFPRLTVMTASSAVSFCSWWMEVLLQKPLQLECLDLSYARAIPISTGLHLGNNTGLKMLALAGEHLTDVDFQVIYNELRNSLELLNVRDNICLTGALDPDFSAGDQGFPNLVSLDASMTRFSDNAVRDIVAMSPKLKTFSLQQCRSVRNLQLRRDPCRFLRGQLPPQMNPSDKDTEN